MQGGEEKDNTEHWVFLPHHSRAALSPAPSVLFLMQPSVIWPLQPPACWPHSQKVITDFPIARASEHFKATILDFHYYSRLIVSIMHFLKFYFAWTIVIQYSAHSSCIFMAIPFVFFLLFFVPPHSLNFSVPRALSSFYSTYSLQELYTLLCNSFHLFRWCCIYQVPVMSWE